MKIHRMFAMDSLYNQYSSILQTLNVLQSEHDLLVRQKNIPQVLVQAVQTQIELTKVQLEKVANQIIYVNPFSGERELPVKHETVILD